jgi:hypothetical protein
VDVDWVPGIDPPSSPAGSGPALFAARTDVYATRFDNPRTGKGGWVPAVRGEWRKGIRHKGIRHEDRDYLPLTPAVLAAHLKGEIHIGLYPLLDGDKYWWLAADFDGPEAMFDALTYIKADHALQVPVAPEVSRSGVEPSGLRHLPGRGPESRFHATAAIRARLIRSLTQKDQLLSIVLAGRYG